MVNTRKYPLPQQLRGRDVIRSRPGEFRKDIARRTPPRRHFSSSTAHATCRGRSWPFPLFRWLTVAGRLPLPASSLQGLHPPVALKRHQLTDADPAQIPGLSCCTGHRAHGPTPSSSRGPRCGRSNVPLLAIARHLDVSAAIAIWVAELPRGPLMSTFWRAAWAGPTSWDASTDGVSPRVYCVQTAWAARRPRGTAETIPEVIWPWAGGGIGIGERVSTYDHHADASDQF